MKLFILTILLGLFGSNLSAAELPSYNQNPAQYSLSVRNYVLSICKTETPKGLFFKEALSRLAHPGMDLSLFLYTNGGLDEWKKRNTKDQFINGMSLDLLSTYQVVWENEGMSTDMKSMIQSESYAESLQECYGDDETSKKIFTLTLMQADVNSVLGALGSGYLSNYFAMKWVGLALSKAGTVAQLGLESRAGIFITRKLKKFGMYLQRYGAKVTGSLALGYAYFTSMTDGYASMETLLTEEEQSIHEIDEQIRAVHESKKEIISVLNETIEEKNIYLKQNSMNPSIINDFNEDINNLQTMLSGMREEQRQLNLKKCQKIFSSELQIARCYSEHSKLVL